MKKLFLYIIVFSISTAFTLSVNAPMGKIKIGEGTTIVYDANFMGEEFDFIVDVTSKDEGVAFDYKMTNKQATQGKVTISKDAMQSALKQNNYFAGGVMQMHGATSIWFSQQAYQEFKNGYVVLDIGNGKETLVLKEELKKQIKVNGKMKKVKVLFGITNANNKFWVLDDKQNPIILEMDTDLKIKIKEIKI